MNSAGAICLVGVGLFTTVIALILFFVGFGGTFVQKLVFSQCIGISITAFACGVLRAANGANGIGF